MNQRQTQLAATTDRETKEPSNGILARIVLWYLFTGLLLSFLLFEC
jgi:hypothetical protein